MRTFRTRDPELLHQFAESYTARSGHPTTVDDLRKDGQWVRVLVEGDAVVGGIVTRWEPPFRYMAVLPDDAELLVDLDFDETMEWTHTWFERGTSGWGRVIMYVGGMIDGLRTGCAIALGGTSERKIRDHQMRLQRHLLYSGPAQDAAGVYPQAWLYYGRRGEMLRSSLGMFSRALWGRRRSAR